MMRGEPLSHPNDPALRSFIPVDPASDFPIQNLPYGVFSTADLPAPRVGVAIGDFVLDLWELEQDCRLDVGSLGVFSAASLNPFMALGPQVWARTRARISELLQRDHDELRDNERLRSLALVPMTQAKLHLPITVTGFTDFYSSREHCSAARTMRFSRTGCTCRSAITAAHLPLWCPAPGCGVRTVN
jgi:fumarylacetoacetase